MAENVERSSGTPEGYKFDRGGNPTEFGPFIGVVMKNVDSTRSGRLWVFIEQLAGNDKTNEDLWRKVDYVPPFYGATQKSGSDVGTGTFAPGNQMSYGMWFTPPDIGVSVICFFVAGDPNQGYYLGCVPEPGVNHMIPAIGSSENYLLQNKTQQSYFADVTHLPVTEINTTNNGITNNPKFFDEQKPVHSVAAAIFFQQGLDGDVERGPITSSAQRESPSTVYGISTPGRAIYQGGLTPASIRQQLEAGTVKPQDINVIGRVGGHTFVMDDGNLADENNLIRLRTSKGHQITMSDSGDFFYIVHANGLTWLELGAEGTVDVFSTNSINLRSQGDINIHADRDINMYSGRNLNIKSSASLNIEAVTDVNVTAENNIALYSKAQIGILSDGSLALKSQSGSWGSGGTLALKADKIDLNGSAAASVKAPKAIVKTTLDDTKYSSRDGWNTASNALESIVTRAPTHEPYPYHNQGTDAVVQLEQGQPAPPPAADPVPSGWSITAAS